MKIISIEQIDGTFRDFVVIETAKGQFVTIDKEIYDKSNANKVTEPVVDESPAE